MAEKAQITGEFPTPSEVASHLRIPATRVAELRRQIAQVTGAAPARRPPRRAKLAKKK